MLTNLELTEHLAMLTKEQLLKPAQVFVAGTAPGSPLLVVTDFKVDGAGRAVIVAAEVAASSTVAVENAK